MMDVVVSKSICVAILIVTVLKASTACPDGFTSHQHSCYKEFPIRASWSEAQTYCAAYGGHIVTVKNAIEETFLQGLIHGHASGFFSSDVFWLDGTDRHSEGTWVWSSSGLSLQSYTNWKPGEPNNVGPGGEDCLTMSFKDNFLWNDMPCANRYNFVCQTSPLGSEIVG